MGTPEFALPSLRGLLDAGYEIGLVVSLPDRPAGRGRQPTPPPVARFARECGLPLFQPASLKPPEAFARVREARPDVVIVVAFGLLLRREVLDLPPLGCLNVHASLLPRWRGAAPIQAALLAGDVETGVCLMRIEPGLDCGPVLACTRTPIAPEDDAPTLHDRLAEMGRDLLLTSLPAWAEGRITLQVQDEQLATYAPKVEREDARLDWSLPAVELWRRVRAYRGWPDAYTTWSGRQLKILAAHPGPPAPPDTPPGRVISTGGRDARPAVATANGLLVLDTVALEGKRLIKATEFARGYRDFIGADLGDGSRVSGVGGSDDVN